MADLKLFRIAAGVATELTGGSVALERSLQRLIESNMETLFGVRLLESEYSTGARHRGRMDSLGIDENYSPVIFEYKRSTNENVINQGLFYLDWLLDHRGEFELLVLRRFGEEAASSVDWRNPRLVCLANDFTRYDEHAVAQMSKSIDLVRYRDFQGELLALELVHSTKTDASGASGDAVTERPRGGSTAKTATELLAQSSPELRDLYDQVDAFATALGDDVARKTLKYYFAFRRIKNFLCVEVHPQSGELLLYLKVNPEDVDLVAGFSRDVRAIGHFGTGDLELRIRSSTDLLVAQPLVERSYNAS